jgi:hypothetical protein
MVKTEAKGRPNLITVVHPITGILSAFDLANQVYSDNKLGN